MRRVTGGADNQVGTGEAGSIGGVNTVSTGVGRGDSAALHGQGAILWQERCSVAVT